MSEIYENEDLKECMDMLRPYFEKHYKDEGYGESMIDFFILDYLMKVKLGLL